MIHKQRLTESISTESSRIGETTVPRPSSTSREEQGEQGISCSVRNLLLAGDMSLEDVDDRRELHSIADVGKTDPPQLASSEGSAQTSHRGRTVEELEALAFGARETKPNRAPLGASAERQQNDDEELNENFVRQLSDALDRAAAEADVLERDQGK